MSAAPRLPRARNAEVRHKARRAAIAVLMTQVETDGDLWVDTDGFDAADVRVFGDEIGAICRRIERTGVSR